MCKKIKKQYRYKLKYNSKIKIVICMILMILSLQVGLEFTNFLKKKSSEIWGVEYFMEFYHLIAQMVKEKKMDYYSKEFQNSVSVYYKQFMLRKTEVYSQIFDVCFEIYSIQLKNRPKENITFLAKVMALDIVEILNKNYVGDNLMDEESVLAEFHEKFPSFLNFLIPVNIFEILKEKKILVSTKGNLSFSNSSVFDYLILTSKEIMSVIQEQPDSKILIYPQKALETMIKDISEKNLLKGIPTKLNKLDQYDLFVELLGDYSNPYQNYNFESSELNRYYRLFHQCKIQDNDKLFHSLISHYLHGCYFSPLEYKDNVLYKQLLKSHERKTKG